MATQAERLLNAAIDRKNRNARIWAYLTLFLFLLISLAANVLTAWEYDIVSKMMAGLSPLSLFVTSMLFERMVANRWIRAGMVLVIVVSFASSWYHITELAMEKHQPWFIAIVLPIAVDVPMLFAGTVLMNQAKPVTLPQTTNSRAAVTTPAKRTKKATTPKTVKTTQTSTVLDPSPVTA